jgi:hypothetical protein
MSTPITLTGTTTVASTTVSALSSTRRLFPGQTIAGAGIPGGATIVSVSGASLVLSAAATAAATVTLTVALVGFTAFVANNIQDASGLPLAAGSLLVQPTDNNNLPITASSGGAGGQMVVAAATFPVAAGSIGAGNVVADTALTLPANISFRITVLDPQSRVLAVYKGVQPTGATFNFDTYTPNVPAQAPYTVGLQGAAGSPGSPVFVDTISALTYRLAVVSGALGLVPANVLADTVTGDCYALEIVSGAATLVSVGATPGAASSLGFIDSVTGQPYALSVVSGAETLTLL